MNLAVRGCLWQKVVRRFPKPSFIDANRALILRFKGGRLVCDPIFPNGVKSYLAHALTKDFSLVSTIRPAASSVGKDPIAASVGWVRFIILESATTHEVR